MINEQTRETDFHIRQFERNSHHDDSSGDYRRGRIFLFDSEYDLDQQYIRAGNCYVALYTVACINDHNDIERCPTADRLCDMRKGVRSKDGLHQHPAAVVSCSI